MGSRQDKHKGQFSQLSPSKDVTSSYSRYEEMKGMEPCILQSVSHILQSEILLFTS